MIAVVVAGDGCEMLLGTWLDCAQVCCEFPSNYGNVCDVSGHCVRVIELRGPGMCRVFGLRAPCHFWIGGRTLSDILGTLVFFLLWKFPRWFGRV